MEKKTIKRKLEISYFWENQLYRKALKLEVIMPYQQILQKYAY